MIATGVRDCGSGCVDHGWHTCLVPIISSYGIAHIGRVGSVLMTLSVTIERFLAITNPLQKKNLKNVLMVSSVVASLLYNVPRFFELERVEMQVEFEGENRTVSLASSLGVNRTFSFKLFYCFSFGNVEMCLIIMISPMPERFGESKSMYVSIL